jgi:dipeptidase D
VSSPLDKLEPRLIWKHFDAIRQIPRPSKYEEQIAKHVVSWGKSQGFETTRDSVGNVLVKVPATAGHE